MDKKTMPKCPYCRPDHMPNGVPMHITDYGNPPYFAECPRCGAAGPHASTVEKAYEKAMHRPLQKPLTVEELKALPEVVYIELAPFAAVESVYAGIPFRVNDIETPSIDIHVLDGCEGFRLDKYGKTWRCWATKPTDEERQAAPWK